MGSEGCVGMRVSMGVRVNMVSEGDNGECGNRQQDRPGRWPDSNEHHWNSVSAEEAYLVQRGDRAPQH